MLFDLDDTLYSRQEWFQGWAEWFVRERLALAAELVPETIGFLSELDGYGYAPRLDMFRTVKSRWPVLDEDERQLLRAFFDDQVGRVVLEPAAASFIDALEAAGLPWGIVSNGSENQLKKLERMGLAGRARCIVVSEVVGLKKPDPAIFHRAAAELDVEPPAVLFIGDNPENDIAGAASAGMQTAWLQRALPWPESLAHIRPDWTVTSLAELVPVLLPGV
ncbi:MAG: HAD family hydrolase [Chloroflexi bacterium]|nr:HAD family hydrolase [Chloroflexota bacterium]